MLYPFESHQLVNAIQMDTHNICFYKENQKKAHKKIALASLDKSLADLF